jgi:plastocyanin
MTIRRALALAAAVAAAALVPAAAHSENPVLVGTVGTDDAFEIDLADSSGNAVKHLDPGTYTIVIHDRSTIHNFHLTGPGVSQTTEVSFVGDVTWTVTFADGVYDFQCDPHAASMHGSFTVGTPPPPAPPPAAPTPLSASVGPGAKIALRDTGGARVAQLAAGRYVVAVSDRTKRDNFHLRGPGVNRTTGVGFVGRARWALTLKGGRYTFRSDRHRKLGGAFTVS